MKSLIVLFCCALFIYSCDATRPALSQNSKTATKGDTIRIANDSLEYEILIIEPGFDTWLVTQPPRGFYEIGYLESRNRLYITTYNQRALTGYRPQLYFQAIEYEYHIHYGYEVNYLLYNYFIYFQKTFRQKL